MDDVQREHICKQRAVVLVIALVGKKHADTWWNSPNKAFDGQTPAGEWIRNYERVYSYLMSHASGDYS